MYNAPGRREVRPQQPLHADTGKDVPHQLYGQLTAEQVRRSLFKILSRKLVARGRTCAHVQSCVARGSNPRSEPAGAGGQVQFTPPSASGPAHVVSQAWLPGPRVLVALHQQTKTARMTCWKRKSSSFGRQRVQLRKMSGLC